MGGQPEESEGIRWEPLLLGCGDLNFTPDSRLSILAFSSSMTYSSEMKSSNHVRRRNREVCFSLGILSYLLPGFG